MAEYINKDTLSEMFERFCVGDCSGCIHDSRSVSGCGLIDNTHAINITFCPHCIHRRRYYNGQTWCALDDRPITDNDFCSFGEEKCDE